MAKGKKSKSSGKVSKGENTCVANRWVNSVKSSTPGSAKMANIVKMWRAGKNPWITVENPDKSNTKARMIRVKTNDYYGNPRKKKTESGEDTDE